MLKAPNCANCQGLLESLLNKQVRQSTLLAKHIDECLKGTAFAMQTHFQWPLANRCELSCGF